jgi:histidinol-phosphatase
VRPLAQRRWIVDPIDGTKSFVRGVPLWGTLVAVAEGDTVLAGAIYCAAVEELVVAAGGQGCWWNGTQCHVSDESRLGRSTVLATDERFPEVSTPAGATPASASDERARRWRGWQRVAEQAAVARTWGDAYGYLLVATGRAEVMMDGIMAPWDSAALAPVVVEAGGVFTDWNGSATAFGGSSVGTNAALAREVRSLLQGEPSP